MPTLRPPEAIFLYSAPISRNITRHIVNTFESIDRRFYFWQVGRFIKDTEVRQGFVPFLYRQFKAARPAFFQLNEDLLPTLWSRTKMTPKMKTFTRPVRIIFGRNDPYLNVGVARKFHELFPMSELFLVQNARHYVQLDEPEEVARLIRSLHTTKNGADG